VASVLMKKSYATACVGKWHLGWNWAKLGKAEEDVDYTKPITGGPTELGFDTFFGISASLDMPPYVYVEDDKLTAIPDRILPESGGKKYWREGPAAPDFVMEEVLDTLSQKATGFIDECTAADKPFFLYFPLPAPHTPILPSEEFQGKSGTNEYGDFCLHVDDIVGRVMAALERGGVTENTILIFTADNGCSPMVDFEELAAVDHYPSYVFRGHKADIYEGGHRVPYIVRWPDRIAKGSVCDETVCLVDLMATCAEIAGLALPDDVCENSVSKLPAWEGLALDTSLREATIHHSINGSFSIRKGIWKLEMCPGSGGWSYPNTPEDCEGLPPIQLYNLDTDIGEKNNVYDQHPDIVEELKALLTRYVEQGRSTPGALQENTGGIKWEQLWWMLSRTPEN